MLAYMKKKKEINKTGKLIVFRVPPDGDYTYVTFPSSRSARLFDKSGELVR